MTKSWTFEGSRTINGVTDPGPIRVLRGSAQTWFSPLRGGDRSHLSLSCMDRRMLLGESKAAVDDSHVVRAAGHRPGVGYHEEVHGHPADNERVVRCIPHVSTQVRYMADALQITIRADTLKGELSRDDGFRADQSPWPVCIELRVPRADVRAVFELSETDADSVDQRFVDCG